MFFVISVARREPGKTNLQGSKLTQSMVIEAICGYTLAMTRSLIGGLLALALALPLPARASVTEKHELIPFRSGEYYALPALAAANLFLIFDVSPSHSHWSGGVLFDGPIRDALRVKTRSERDGVALAGDLMLYTLIAYPGVVDAGLDAAWSKHDMRIGTQLFLINMQAYLLSGVASFVVKKLTARQRPFEQECNGDPNYDIGCHQKDSRLSFYSGHAAFSFTAAGLICAHHENLELWGQMTPCYVSIGAAAAVGLTRIIADRHYATDVLVGSLVGWLSGYTISRLYHYKEESAAGKVQMSIVPVVYPEGLGVNFAFAGF